MLFCDDVTVPKAVDWLPVPSHVEIADTLGNAVTFLPTALRGGTHTLFSLQGTVDLFSHRCQKVETAKVKTLRETRLTTATGSDVACGGFRIVIRDCFVASRAVPTELHVCGGGARSSIWCQRLPT